MPSPANPVFHLLFQDFLKASIKNNSTPTCAQRYELTDGEVWQTENVVAISV